jgi:hypothetical protein
VASGPTPYPVLQRHLARGQQIFAAQCGSCHSDGAGANTTTSTGCSTAVYSPTVTCVTSVTWWTLPAARRGRRFTRSTTPCIPAGSGSRRPRLSRGLSHHRASR